MIPRSIGGDSNRSLTSRLTVPSRRSPATTDETGNEVSVEDGKLYVVVLGETVSSDGVTMLSSSPGFTRESVNTVVRGGRVVRRRGGSSPGDDEETSRPPVAVELGFDRTEPFAASIALSDPKTKVAGVVLPWAEASAQSSRSFGPGMDSFGWGFGPEQPGVAKALVSFVAKELERLGGDYVAVKAGDASVTAELARVLPAGKFLVRSPGSTPSPSLPGISEMVEALQFAGDVPTLRVFGLNEFRSFGSEEGLRETEDRTPPDRGHVPE